MLSVLYVALAIASLPPNSVMKANFINYTAPESGNKTSGVLGHIAGDVRNESGTGLKKECQGRCESSKLSAADFQRNISTPDSLLSVAKAGKVIIETQIQSNLGEIASTDNSVRKSDKKFKWTARKMGEEASTWTPRNSRHKSTHAVDISFGKVVENSSARNMSSISTTAVSAKKAASKDKRNLPLSRNQSITTERSTANDVTLRDILNYGTTRMARIDDSDKAFSTPITGHTSSSRSVDFSESSVSSKKLSNGGTSLWATWGTAGPTEPDFYVTTTKPRTYGVVKYDEDHPRRSLSPIGDLLVTRSTFFNVSDSVSRPIQPEIPWPVKKEAVVEGDLVLGGLMMVHEREDTVTCGPVMPQGGIQALEAMLYTLDRLNFGPDPILPNITLGAHILDDCDKDTYGLEMAVDFIKETCLTVQQNKSTDGYNVHSLSVMIGNSFKELLLQVWEGFRKLEQASSKINKVD